MKGPQPYINKASKRLEYSFLASWFSILLASRVDNRLIH